MFTGELLVVGNVHLVDLDIKYGYMYIASYMDPSWFSKNTVFLSNGNHSFQTVPEFSPNNAIRECGRKKSFDLT